MVFAPRPRFTTASIDGCMPPRPEEARVMWLLPAYQAQHAQHLRPTSPLRTLQRACQQTVPRNPSNLFRCKQLPRSGRPPARARVPVKCAPRKTLAGRPHSAGAAQRLCALMTAAGHSVDSATPTGETSLPPPAPASHAGGSGIQVRLTYLGACSRHRGHLPGAHSPGAARHAARARGGAPHPPRRCTHHSSLPVLSPWVPSLLAERNH